VTQSTDELIARAIDGDQAALSMLLVQSHDRLLGYIRRRLPLDLERHCDPEDVLQDAFTLAFQQISTLRRADEAAFVSWLTVIAQNRLRNITSSHRAQKRGGDWVRVANDGGGADGRDGQQFATDLLELLSRNSRSPRSIAGNHEYIGLIRHAIGELDPAHRDVLRLRFIDNLPHAEIADQLGRTEPAVRQLCLRALRRLRWLLPMSSAGA
jgi:RNA polymerase sigma-70 factor, ECF subfamily